MAAEDWLRLFEDDQCSVRGCTSRTSIFYSQDIGQFLTFLGDEDPRTAGSDRILGYLATLAERGARRSTISRKCSALRAFYEFLLSRGEVATDPTVGLGRSPGRAAVVRPVLSPEQVESLLTEVAPDERSKREIAIRALLYSTGLSCAELVALDCSDLDRQALCLAVKPGTRHVLLDGRTWRLLSCQVEACAGGRPLFVGERGERLGCRTVQQELTRAGKRLLGLPVTARLLKDSFIAHCLAAGVDLRVIRSLLGQASATIRGRAQPVDLPLRRIYDQTHPRARRLDNRSDLRNP